MALKIALVAPSSAPFMVGGAEKMWWGLSQYVNQHTEHVMDLIKLPSPEHDFASICRSYEHWSALDLSHFDAVISCKYPAWMVDHPNHVVYLIHKLRGLYDTYPKNLPLTPPHLSAAPAVVQALWRCVQRPGGERGELAEIFARARELLASQALAEPDLAQLTALPGPLLRALVRKLDAIAFRPGAVRRYLAISGVVAQRADYFPADARVQVLPHPSDMRGLLRSGPFETVFAASRFDSPKRFDLLIKAYRRSRTTVPLRIAGVGPQAQYLRDLAGDDARIRFLGFLKNEAMVQEYSRAALVPFVPYQEDMGLITLEAMGCGKPVLTCSDSGGVTEFVRDGVNGRIVEPTEKAVAAALDEMLADSAALQRMGQAALESAGQVTWQRTVEGLLAAAQAGMAERMQEQARCDQAIVGAGTGAGIAGAKAATGPRRPRLLVLNTFEVFPPDHGGKKRMYYLYKGIAQWADVTLLSLGLWGQEARERVLAAQLREVCIAPSQSFVQAEHALSKALGGKSVTDIAALLYGAQLGDFRAAFEVLARECDVVVCAHVYLAALAQQCWQGPLWYDAFNVEADMKAVVLEQPALQQVDADVPLHAPDVHAPDLAARCVRLVAAAEARLVRHAQRVWTVSEADRERFAALYGRDVQTMELAVNGTHLPQDAWLDAARRGALKQRLGFGTRPLAVFVGSFHVPNWRAADEVLALARACPQWSFALVGSVCRHVQKGGRAGLPANVLPLDVLEEGALRSVLRAADVGLNPMLGGSGTNLKMLDYAGHGVLILSTPTGARGLAFVAGEHYIEREVHDFAAALQPLAAQCPAPQPAMRTQARVLAEQVYAWEAIAAALKTTL